MKKSLAKQIAALWNAQFAGLTVATKTKAVVEEPKQKIHYATSWAVEIHPEGEWNDGFSFHHCKEFADVIRAFKVSGYVYIEDGKVVGRLY